MSSSGGRLGWYARRLRTMRPAEVAWRVGRLGQGLAAPVVERRPAAGLPDDPAWWHQALDDFRAAHGRPVLLDRARAAEVARTEPDAVRELVAAAERVLAHRVTYFGYPEADLGPAIDFHHDPLADHDWPCTAARRLDHRTAPADVKWIWELNRLQHLPWLAEAWLLTGRDEFAAEALAQLDGWLDQNPVGVGIAWRGAFEVGVRATSVLVALQGLRDHPGLDVERFRRVVTVLDAGARMSWRERSRFSSANNHLVGELVGLMAVGLLLPELRGSEGRVTRALRELVREADLQLLPDGAGAEQAVGYQMFTAELLLVVAVLLRSAGRPVPEQVEAALRRSGGYLAGLVADDEPAPRYGDDDEGFALRLGPVPVRTVDDHLALLRAYAAPADPVGPPVAPAVAVDAAWIRGATRSGVPVSPLVPAAPERSFHAADGGLVVLRRETPEGRQRVTVDVGPLGYLALAAHGHADALALTWTVDGREVVTDPGTGSYYGHPAWRVAHRSTSMHATVAVDGQDQSVIAGPFMWSEHASVRVREVDLERGVVDAEHDGYRRLDGPVQHRRRVVVPPGESFVVVLDELYGEGDHDVRVSWPLAPDLTVRAEPDGHLVLRDGRAVAQVATVATVPLVHAHVVGDETTNQGWWSHRLEGRVPAPLLTATGAGRLPVVVATVLAAVGPDGAAPVHGLDVEVVDGEAFVTWGDAGDRSGGRGATSESTPVPELVRTGPTNVAVRLTSWATGR